MIHLPLFCRTLNRLQAIYRSRFNDLSVNAVFPIRASSKCIFKLLREFILNEKQTFANKNNVKNDKYDIICIINRLKYRNYQ